MGQVDPEFLRIVAPIAVTLMGFAFLTPIIQAISSGLFSHAELIIKNHTIYGYLFLFIFLPLFAFFWPLLNSLLLLIFNNGVVEWFIRVISVVLAIIIIVWITWMRRQKVNTDSHLLDFMLTKLTRLYLTSYAITGIFAAYWTWEFEKFIYCTNLSFLILGVLFLIDSMLSPFDKAILFKTSASASKDSDLNPKWVNDVEKNLAELTYAYQRTEQAVKDLMTRLKKNNNIPEEWCAIIAKYSSEIEYLRKQLEGSVVQGIRLESLQGLKKRWQELKFRRKSTLSELIEFDNWRSKIVIEYFPGFERTTDEIKILLRELN